MIRKSLTLMALLGTGLCTMAQDAPATPAPAPAPQAASAAPAGGKVILPWEETDEQRDARMQWWRDAKFGMFIHYGLYSGLGGFFKGEFGGGEWIQRNMKLDTETYAAEALPRFKPAPGCTEAWADLAAYAGCRYAVLTTKHHEGFALFDTDSTDYCAGKAVGRDIVKEYTDSFRKRGIRIGLYHSVIDWHHQDYDNTICPDLCYPEDQEAMLKKKGIPRNHESYLKYLHGQVRELLTKYGDISILWWDYSQGAAEGDRGWKATELMTMAHSLQPGIIMNNRLYNLSGFDASKDGEVLPRRHGDYTSPEKRIPAKGYPGVDWEACMTVGDKWGFCSVDLKFKSPQEVISKLEECAAKGGNFLLNVGPRADGSIPAALVKDFRRVGDWMKVNSESIYESRGVLDVDFPEGVGASMVREDMYVFLPAAQKQDYVLRIPATQIENVAPSILGQPECKVQMRRVEEPGQDEPKAYMEFTVPAAAWEKAVEGLPVLKLSFNP